MENFKKTSSEELAKIVQAKGSDAQAALDELIARNEAPDANYCSMCENHKVEPCFNPDEGEGGFGVVVVVIG